MEDEKEQPTKQDFSESTTIGINVEIKDFAVISTGQKLRTLNI